MREAGVAVALVLIVLFFSATAPYFATPENFLKIFVQIGDQHGARLGHDLRHPDRRHRPFGRLGARAVHGRRRADHDRQEPAGRRSRCRSRFSGCMGVGAFCGFVNGFVVEQWKVPSFIVTLGMLNVASGAARVTSNNSTITGLPQPFVDFGNLIVFGVFPVDLPHRGRRHPGRLVHPALHRVRPVHLRHRHQRGGGAPVRPFAALLQDRRLHHQRAHRGRRRDGLFVAPQRRQPDRRRRLRAQRHRRGHHRRHQPRPAAKARSSARWSAPASSRCSAPGCNCSASATTSSRSSSARSSCSRSCSTPIAAGC